MRKFIRPNVKKMAILENKHFVDFYYPTVYSVESKHRVFLSTHGVIIRKSTLTAAKEYAKRFSEKEWEE